MWRKNAKGGGRSEKGYYSLEGPKKKVVTWARPRAEFQSTKKGKGESGVTFAGSAGGVWGTKKGKASATLGHDDSWMDRRDSGPPVMGEGQHEKMTDLALYIFIRKGKEKGWALFPGEGRRRAVKKERGQLEIYSHLPEEREQWEKAFL